MKLQFTHTIEHNGREVPVKFEANYEYNGIGPYEFWGQKCFDRGTLALEEIYALPNQNLSPGLENKINYLVENIFDLETPEITSLMQAADSALSEKTEETDRPEIENEKKFDNWKD